MELTNKWCIRTKSMLNKGKVRNKNVKVYWSQLI